MKKIILTLAVTYLWISCQSNTYEEISESITLPTTVTYNANVKSVIESRCISCHSAGGPAASYPFTSYDLVKSSIDNIIDRIQRPNGDPLRMPPGGSLSPGDIDIIIKWKNDGLTEN